MVPGNHGADTFRSTGIDHIARNQVVIVGQMSDQSRYRMNQQAEIGGLLGLAIDAQFDAPFRGMRNVSCGDDILSARELPE